jgi:hypothetical protein
MVKPTTKFIFATTISSPKRPAALIDRPIAKQRKCGVCGQLGHNRRKCPAAPAATAAPVVDGQVGDGNDVNSVTKDVPPPPPVLQAEDYGSNIDWGSVLYVVFDLETTGRSRQRDEIIALAAVILDENGIEIEDASFSQFVKPRNPLPPFITELTSITNNDVSLAEGFPAVGDASSDLCYNMPMNLMTTCQSTTSFLSGTTQRYSMYLSFFIKCMSMEYQQVSSKMAGLVLELTH